MPGLLIEVEGRTLHFDDTRLLKVGRSIDADVLLTAASVSRAHAELRPVEGGWMLVDTGSHYGTFVDGTRVREQRVDGSVTVQCGPAGRGSSFTVVSEGHERASEVGGAAVARAPAPPPSGPSGSAGPPFAPPSGPPGSPAARPGPSFPPPDAASPPTERPAGAGAPPPTDSTQVLAAINPAGAPPRTGPDLLVVAGGREFRFRHPAQLRVGRQAGCEIPVDDPTASRLHGVVSAVPGGWVYTNQSSEGTFDEGRRVESRRFDEQLDLRLGHPVAGTKVSLVPVLSAAEEERRFARRRRRRVLLTVGAAAAALVLVAGTVVGVVALTGDDGPGSAGGQTVDSMAVLTDSELASAKAATVLLVAETTDATGRDITYSGSGSMVSSDGKILTNAHVAQPSAEGLSDYYSNADDLDDPEYLLVALVDGSDDSPAEPEYRAKPLTVDGERDAAVVQIYADADGNSVDTGSLDLPTMPIGDSDELQSGDDVTVLGFPGISESAHLTVTTGVISTFIDRTDLGPRSEIDTDARIAPGNSGGAAIDNDARIIGIPSALFSETDSPIVSGRIRPINFVSDLLDEAGVPH